MNLTISYNWPTGENKAHATLGQPNVNDCEFEFRLGILPVEHPGMVYWCEPGWVVGQNDLSVFVKREDVLVVERRKVGTDTIERIKEWDIDSEWPPEASGPTLVTAPWFF